LTNPVPGTKQMKSVDFKEFIQNKTLTATETATRLAKKNKYKLAVLKDRNGDLKQRWYVEFFIEDPASGKLERKREFIPQKLKTVTERLAYAEDLIEVINKLLKSGELHQERQIKAEEKENSITLNEALDQAVEFFKTFLRPRTLNSYNQTVENLKKWCRENYPGILARNFNESLASKFVSDHFKGRKVKNKTYNGYLTNCKAVFKRIMQQKNVKINPFSSLELLPVNQPEIVLWKEDDKKKIAEYLQKHDPALYCATLLVYHCFLRPNEIMQLKFKDVMPEKGIIVTPSSAAKNRQNKPVTMSNKLVEIFSEMKKHWPEDYLVFSKNLQPGTTLLHRNRMSDRFRDARKACGISDDLKMYYFKHTGNSEMIQKGANIGDLMEQNRHFDVSITAKYVKRMNANANKLFMENSGEF
jgi:integrase